MIFIFNHNNTNILLNEMIIGSYINVITRESIYDEKGVQTIVTPCKHDSIIKVKIERLFLVQVK